MGKKVRCTGYRHSWSDLFTDESEILISMLPLHTAVDLPSVEGEFHPGSGRLQQISIVPGSVSPDGSTVLAKIGTATTNEQFREWCLDPQGGNVSWTLPLNVIMVEITFGGSVSPICHGAGIRNGTLSDLVAEVEYVDANGNMHTVSDPELLKTAAGAFGLLGVVTAYTLRLDKMTYANQRPSKVPVELAVPPPQEYIDAARKGDKRYSWIKDLMAKHTQEAIDAARAEFVAHVEEDYYAEYFWFPLQPVVWVNTWKNDGDKAVAKDLPDKFQVFLQWMEEWISETINNWVVWIALPGELQAKLLGFLTLTQLPNITGNDKSCISRRESADIVVTELINGLHFRRGIQNMRVYDMEWEIEIPSLVESKTVENVASEVPKTSKPTATETTTGEVILTADASISTEPAKPTPSTEAAAAKPPVKRDWNLVQKAWWDGVLLMHSSPSIVRVALEMRVMGGSQVHLAPQNGYTNGACSIEILTTPNTLPRDWEPFCQRLTDIWLNYRDGTGNLVRARPHWCKQWDWLRMPTGDGKSLPAREWMRTVAYKDEIPLFLDGLKRIGEVQGWTVDDLRQRFGNTFFEDVLFGVVSPLESDGQPEPKPTLVRRVFGAIKRVFVSCFS
jgi:hypothetical protein